MRKKVIINTILVTLTIAVVGIGLTYYSQIYELINDAINPEKPPETETVIDIQQADLLFEQGQYDQAFSYYTDVIQSQKDLAQAYAGLGNISIQWRRYDDAVNYYSSSLKYNLDASVLAHRCTAYQFLAKYEAAMDDCNLSIEMNPYDIEGYEALATLELAQYNINASRDAINKALTINQNSADLYYVSAQIYTSENRLDDAINEFTNCINIDPNAVLCYWERGFDYYMIGKFDLSINDMRSILDRGNPETDSELLYKAGNLLNMLDQSSK
jgi:tetratricopeptide (TPR) repeat protein